MKILVAMSGGVDSSVAAALLAQQGHDVTGVHMKLSEESNESGGKVHGCCTVEAADDARRVAQSLDIPFYVWNLKDAFGEGVMDDFVREYARGRTPNPCARCNETVKFGALAERGRALGFDAVATGHYARLEHEGDRVRMFRAVDQAKDQSYVLATLSRSELSFARFPLGAMTKKQTRQLARDLALRTADKPESFDICFVPDGDAAAFVERRGGSTGTGPMLDANGNTVGSHDGLHRFTVGQRKGLGLGGSERRFVLGLDPVRNAVVVGPGELLARGGLVSENVRWIGEPVIGAVGVQIRAHGEAIPAIIDPDGATVRFSRPERGVAPGQLVAFYREDEALGAGTIAASLPVAHAPV